MPFIFSNAALLAGLAALGLPVLLHLLLKRKNQRLRFSTNRFFQPQETRSKSKRKLRNLVLLAMRLIIFTLIALAFARPYLPLSFGGGRTEPRRQMVVVLDRSLSLRAQDTTGSRWAGALKATKAVLAKLTGDDRAAIISCAVRSTVLTPFGPADVTARKLEGVEPTMGSADLADGLREALRLLALSDKGYAPVITIVSDFQQSTCQNLSTVKLPADVEVRLVNVGDYAAPNIAVADLNLAAAETNKPFAVFANHGDEDLKALETEFLVDGKPVSTKPVAIGIGAAKNVELELPKSAPGWHSAEVRIRTKDSLAIDDSRYGAYYIPPSLHVLIVESKKGVRSYQEDSFFLTAALDPAWGQTNAAAAHFAIERCAPAALADRLRQALATKAKSADGTGGVAFDPEVVIVPSPKQLDGGSTAVLQDYVQGGGGLLLFLGDGLSASRFNTDLAAILPAQIVKAENADADFFWRVGEYDHRAPSLSFFQLPNSGNLGLTLFSHRWSLQTMPGSKVDARFDDGPPLLCSRVVGRGQVLMVNTTPDTSWSDWPKHKTFVPWVHNAVMALANKTHESRVQPGETLVADADEELELGANPKQVLTLRDPQLKESSVTPSEHGVVDLHLTQPGIYSFRDDTGREVRRIAVNVPAAESDLISFKPTEVQQQLVREEAKPESNLTAGLFGGDRQRKEYWRLLLLTALAVLLLETMVSNRSSQ